VFNGQTYKDHISCITEQEKHWGEFAKPKHLRKTEEIKTEDKKIEAKKA